jgi:hypothetical protein
MSNLRSGLLLALLAAVFTFALIHAFSIHLAGGTVYPPYSSLRSNPDGAKLLYDSLARTAGIAVSRNYFPLEYLDQTQATVLLLGVDAEQFADPKGYPEDMEHLAGRGDRAVATLRWSGDKAPDHTEDLDKRWHIKYVFDAEPKHPHRLSFNAGAEWSVLNRDGDKILAVERHFQKGSMVLLSESRDFSNAATVAMDRLAVVSAAIGDNQRVVFDEQHFGIAESGTVVGLARRFGLGGMAIGLAFCAALFIWKNASSFPPPAASASPATLAGRTSISGLHTLLSRHIRPADLAATCWSEWLAGNRGKVTADRVARAQAILQDRTRKPLDAVREIQTVLYSKGPL